MGTTGGLLAACYRLLAHYGMTDLIYTHSTARVPGEPGHFLINPYGYRWEEITASSLVKIDVDGAEVGDSPHRVNPAGFTIHSAVHMARHDAVCVIHTHTRAGMAVSAAAPDAPQGRPLQPNGAAAKPIAAIVEAVRSRACRCGKRLGRRSGAQGSRRRP